MKGNVIYLNIWHGEKFYQINDEEIRKRLQLQDYMRRLRAEIEYQSREFNEYQKMIYKEQSHNNIRKSWKLISDSRS